MRGGMVGLRRPGANMARRLAVGGVGGVDFAADALARASCGGHAVQREVGGDNAGPTQGGH